MKGRWRETRRGWAGVVPRVATLSPDHIFLLPFSRPRPSWYRAVLHAVAIPATVPVGCPRSSLPLPGTLAGQIWGSGNLLSSPRPGQHTSPAARLLLGRVHRRVKLCLTFVGSVTPERGPLVCGVVLRGSQVSGRCSKTYLREDFSPSSFPNIIS